MEISKFVQARPSNSNISTHMIKYFSMGRHLGFVVGRGLPSCIGNESAVRSIRASRNDFVIKKFDSSKRYVFPVCASYMFICRSFSSNVDTGSKSNIPDNVSCSANVGESVGQNTVVVGNEWLDTNKISQSIRDAIFSAGKMAKETSDELFPYLQQAIDSQPYLKDVIVPVSGTLSATLLAWLVMPRLLRKVHKSTTQNPLALLSAKFPQMQFSYERSLWSVLEDPARYLVTFMAFSQLKQLIHKPYLKDVIVPVSGTLSATLLAWLVMPRLLRKVHKSTMQNPLALLSAKFPQM